MVFECSFPAVLIGPGTALCFVAVAAAFHLGNVAAFGLNRFLLAWGATWPAIWYMSGQLS
jgi:pantothenate kinase type III